MENNRKGYIQRDHSNVIGTGVGFVIRRGQASHTSIGGQSLGHVHDTAAFDAGHRFELVEFSQNSRILRPPSFGDLHHRLHGLKRQSTDHATL